MVRYASLLKLTPQGARKLEQSTERARIFRQEAEAAGVSVEVCYWCVGAYDALIILSAPDEHAALHQIARLARAGNVSPESLRLYTADEFDSLMNLTPD